MRKVAKDFYCIKTKKTYKKGDTYKGKRKDLDHVLEPSKKQNKKAPETKKGAISKK